MSSTSTPSLNNSESMNMQMFLILTSCLYVLVLNKGEQSQTNKEKLSSFSRNRFLCLFLDKKVNVRKKKQAFSGSVSQVASLDYKPVK